MTSRHIYSNPKTSKILRSRVILLAITISAATIFLLTLIYIIYHLWYTLLRRSRTSPFESSTPLKLQKFTYKELKSATNGFNPDHSIGKGGSGTVFRGVLRDGKSVAIKRLDGGATSIQAEREFQSEVTILGSIRSPYIVSLLGYCIEKSKRVLVYEYMPNRSLQDYLFCNNGEYVGWDIRFKIIQDVAKAVEFLHNECDPPVIHGDIKPSNVLLDWDFKAKISDFGLSRVKDEDEFGVEMFSQEMGRSQDLWKSQDLSGNLVSNVETPTTVGTPVEGQGSGVGGGVEVDFALALQASSSSKNSKALINLQNLNGLSSKASPKGKEVMVDDGGGGGGGCGSLDHEVSSIEHSKELELNPSQWGKDKELELNPSQWGKDWWWRQDDSGELSSKDYVTEWIGTQICPSTNPEWENVNSTIESNLPRLVQLDKSKEGFEQKSGEKNIKKKKRKPRKMQDWWKEEENGEEKGKGRSKRKSLKKKMKRTIRMPHFDLGRRFYFLKRGRKSSVQNQTNCNPSHEFSFKRGWRRKHARSMSEMSGDLYSRELSSTTSMRGTLCYVAPECGACGYLMEKGDIYSLGVLILVIVSGRRPLHVLNSPMKLEKANLISWCRQLAQTGNVLELVDERLKDAYNKEQASLCVNLALACLQRMPELRPDIGDIVRILRGEMDLPPLPFEFSPSPPSKLYSRSRRKLKT